ncbi:MAG: peroxide stress protein YaaA [Acidimicrobiales bacterium]
MSSRLFVLVPPSQGKAEGGRRRPGHGRFDDVLTTARLEVTAALRSFLGRATLSEREATFGARGPLLDRTVLAAQALVEGTAPLLPAWRRYQGIVWNYLNPGTLTSSQRRRILVPSGLYGLVAGEDPVAEYRLRMNAGLAGVGVLARYWRPHVTPVLLEATTRAAIVNFLPHEHAASIDWTSVEQQRRVVTVRFMAADESRAVGHDAKAIKGELAGAVLRDGLAAFDVEKRLGWTIERRGDVVIARAPLAREIGVKS